VLFQGSLAPLAAFLGWLLGQPALAGFAWRAEDAGIGVLATLPMLVGTDTGMQLALNQA
jgi:hypothetical protein